MSEQPQKSGSCLCGAVRFRARLAEQTLSVCHCRQCQRWTGGGALYTVRVRDVEITGSDAITAYQASAHGERAFCSTCGTALFWRMQGGQIISLPPALFDEVLEGPVAEEIFVDQRAPWQPAYAGASQSTEAEQMALLEAYLAKQGDAR